MKNNVNNTVTSRILALYTIVSGFIACCVIPYLPAKLLGGWMPSQLVVYIVVLLCNSVVWGILVKKIMDNQSTL